jgi:predicted small metal-binding protein
MNKVLKCRDVGTDCGFEGRGKTAEEILVKV